MTLWEKLIGLFSVPDLHREINNRDMEIAQLKLAVAAEKETVKRLRANPGPSFAEVATELPMPELYEEIKHQVIEDLTPFVKNDVIRALPHMFKGTRVNPDRHFRVVQATEMYTKVRHVRVEFEAMGTVVQVMEGY